MAYRNGTYVAFVGCGTTDPTKSDIKYYNLMKGWKERGLSDFVFNNSHDKVGSVRDTSTIETLKRNLRERFKNSKNIVFIITEKTISNWNSILKYEVEVASELGLPFLFVYPKKEIISNVNSLSDLWPFDIENKINRNEIKAIHFPFKLHLFKDAIPRWTLHECDLNGSKNFYNNDFQNKF